MDTHSALDSNRVHIRSTQMKLKYSVDVRDMESGLLISLHSTHDSIEAAYAEFDSLDPNDYAGRYLEVNHYWS
jgi:hypothetical protein